MQAKLLQSPTKIIEAWRHHGRPSSLQLKRQVRKLLNLLENTATKKMKGHYNCCLRLLRQFWPLDSSEGRSDTAQQGWVLGCHKSGRNSHFCIFIPDDMASISTMMPLNFIAELKWMSQGAFGCSPFTSLKSGLKSTWCCAKTSNWPSGSQSAWALPLLCQWPVTFAVQCWKGW